MQTGDFDRICTRSAASRLESGSSSKNTLARPPAYGQSPHADADRQRGFRFAIQQMRQLQHFRHLVNRWLITSFFAPASFRPNDIFSLLTGGDRARKTETPYQRRVRWRSVIHPFLTDEQVAAGDRSSPAIMRSKVDLPQPDGPTKPRIHLHGYRD